jgi:hypothetical protein
MTQNSMLILFNSIETPFSLEPYPNLASKIMYISMDCIDVRRRIMNSSINTRVDVVPSLVVVSETGKNSYSSVSVYDVPENIERVLTLLEQSLTNPKKKNVGTFSDNRTPIVNSSDVGSGKNRTSITMIQTPIVHRVAKADTHTFQHQLDTEDPFYVPITSPSIND